MDPIMHDAEALARALDARAALGAAAAEGLSPELREALAAAEGLERWRDPLAGGPRLSFVQSLEDQLRADLRTGIGRAARREASPWAGPTLLAGALLLVLGLLLGRILSGGHLADRLPAAVPAGLASEPDTVTDGRAAALLTGSTGLQPQRAVNPGRLPLLTTYPLPQGAGLDLAGPLPVLPERVADRSPAAPAGAAARAAAPPDRSGDGLPAPGAPQAQAPAPQGVAPQPQPEAPPEAPDEDPEEAPAAALAAPTAAPAPPPERTPDADPEP